MSIRQPGRVAYVHSLLGASSNPKPPKRMASYPQQTTHSFPHSKSFSVSICMATQNLSRSLRHREALVGGTPSSSTTLSTFLHSSPSCLVACNNRNKKIEKLILQSLLHCQTLPMKMICYTRSECSINLR